MITRRLFPILAILFVLSAELFAGTGPYYGELYGLWQDSGDEGTLDGAGLTVGRRIYANRLKDLSLVGMLYWAGRRNHADKPQEETVNLIPLLLGARLGHEVFFQGFSVTATAGVGAAFIQTQKPKHYGPFIDPSKTESRSDFGPSATLRAGILYTPTQSLSFYAEGGYSASLFYADFKDKKIRGAVAFLGIRYTFGSRQPLW